VHANKDLIEQHVYARVCDLTNLQLTLACCDLTSTYLEGDPAGHSRFRPRRSATRGGPALGLAAGGDRAAHLRGRDPDRHHVFAGGTQDATTLKGVLEDLTRRFAVGRIWVVADRGLITDDNIAEVEAAKCDWLFPTCLSPLGARRPGVWDHPAVGRS
jgi:hypothetical protein